ncbi:hypothetical protein MMC13_000528 [Lambiella insularis]|nr:hypothetical protein [Lambiella insularis]
MVFYIRFLKVPNISTQTRSGFTVKTVVSITTDLGDDFYASNVELFVHLEYDGDVRRLTSSFPWKAGARALPIDFTLKTKDYPGLLRLCVTNVNTQKPQRLCKSHLPQLVSGWSDAFGIPNAGQTPRRIQRQFVLEGGGQLLIWEDTGESIARHIWDAAIGLIAHLQDIIHNQAGTRICSKIMERLRRPEPTPIRIIELGSGCGIVGIALAQMLRRCQVILTDLPEAMEMLDLNMPVAQLLYGSKLRKMPLDWAEDLPPSLHSMEFDFVLVSDCTYNSDSLPALVRTLSALTSNSPRALVVVSMKVRHSSEAVFFDLMVDAGFAKDAGPVKIDLPGATQSPKEVETIDIYTFIVRDDSLTAGASHVAIEEFDYGSVGSISSHENSEEESPL